MDTGLYRVVGRSENPEVPSNYLGGHNLSPLVEIGLTDLPKSGCAMAPPGTPRAYPGTTPLYLIKYLVFAGYSAVAVLHRLVGLRCFWTPSLP